MKQYSTCIWTVVAVLYCQERVRGVNTYELPPVPAESRVLTVSVDGKKLQ